MKKFPIKIEDCPIIDFIIELRFESKINPNAVFGVIFKELKDQYSAVEPLPIQQIPLQLRNIDPTFKFKPYFKISDGSYNIQIGPDVVNFGSFIPYPGWSTLSNKIYSCIESLKKSDVILHVTRLGLRVINFFPEDKYSSLFNEINIVLNSKDESFPNFNNTYIRTNVEYGEFISTIQIAEKMQKQIESKSTYGSVIDIDSFKNYQDDSFLNNFKSEIEIAHKCEKELFFNILFDDFIMKLKPIYE